MVCHCFLVVGALKWMLEVRKDGVAERMELLHPPVSSWLDGGGVNSQV